MFEDVEEAVLVELHKESPVIMNGMHDLELYINVVSMLKLLFAFVSRRAMIYTFNREKGNYRKNRYRKGDRKIEIG